MSDDSQRPIVVKKIKKGGHGHHGGAWKIAYADFVTNSAAATRKEEAEAGGASS